jgi:hypothetical protein
MLDNFFSQYNESILINDLHMLMWRIFRIYTLKQVEKQQKTALKDKPKNYAIF